MEMVARVVASVFWEIIKALVGGPFGATLAAAVLNASHGLAKCYDWLLGSC